MPNPTFIDGYSVSVISSNVRSPRLRNKVLHARLTTTPAREGDLVLVRATSDEGAIVDIESHDGNYHRLRSGEYAIGVACHRESGRSLNGVVPDKGLLTGSYAHVLSNACGIGLCTSHPPEQGAMSIEILGVLSVEGRTINIRDQLGELTLGGPMGQVILVGGTSAECGKTTAARILIEELSKTVRVGAAKISGTGRLRDIADLRRAGAVQAYDFVDGGLPSTYGDTEVSSSVAMSVVQAAASSVDFAIVEAGGDLIWAGVPQMLTKLRANGLLKAMVLSANDALGAFGASDYANEMGLPVSCVVGPVCNTMAGRQRLATLRRIPTFNIRDQTERPLFAQHVADFASMPN